MNREDLVKLIGVGSSEAEYLPVAFLLCNGYACAGYYHAAVNEGLSSACVLLNAHLAALEGGKTTGRATIADFNEFLEEIVADFCAPGREARPPARSEIYGTSIPLTAIPFDQIAVVYPVAHIGALMRRAEQQEKRRPTFLDLDKSEIVGLLRTKLW